MNDKLRDKESVGWGKNCYALIYITYSICVKHVCTYILQQHKDNRPTRRLQYAIAASKFLRNSSTWSWNSIRSIPGYYVCRNYSSILTGITYFKFTRKFRHRELFLQNEMKHALSINHDVNNLDVKMIKVNSFNNLYFLGYILSLII